MNRPTHRQALLAGLAVILGVNAIALGGAAYNRGGEDSRLRLSERELQLPYHHGPSEEDSGVSLRVVWQSARVRKPDEEGSGVRPWEAAAWLDAKALQRLGFDLTPPTVRTLEQAQWRYRERNVLVVLEMDGPAHARWLAGELAYYARRRAELEARPASTETREQLRELERQRHQAEHEDTRLFAVDVGLDREALRRKYPDRRRYALVPALVQLYWRLDKGLMKPEGSISELVVGEIHVSKSQARAIGADRDSTSAEPRRPFEVQLAYGRRLEPWIADARPRPASPR
jgi:hypothetical protein